MSELDSIRLARVRLIMSELDIGHLYLDAAVEHNSFSHQTYHNVQHLFTVALRAYEGADFYGLSSKATRVLFVAALLHDLGHAADPSVHDVENVVHSANLASELLVDDVSFSTKEMNRIVNLIVGTDRSRTLVSSDPLQGILNDADMMQSFEEDSEIWLNGLAAETNSIVNIETTIAFMKYKNVSTHWGANVVTKGIRRLKEANDE